MQFILSDAYLIGGERRGEEKKRERTVGLGLRKSRNKGGSPV